MMGNSFDTIAEYILLFLESENILGNLIISTFGSVLAVLIGFGLQRLWRLRTSKRIKDRIGKAGYNSIYRYFETQLENIKSICEFDFDPEKDYIENSKVMLRQNIPREYRRHLWRWRILPRRILSLADVTKIASQPTKAGRVCAVTGEPASGKTVEMLKIFAGLAAKWAPGRPLPILIFVNALSQKSLDEIFSEENPGLIKIVEKYLRESPDVQSPIPPDFVATLQNQWSDLHPVLLFDAVDEMPDKNRYERLVALLCQGAEKLKDSATVVFSCRERDYSGRTAFAKLRILPLSRQQTIKHYKSARARRESRLENILESPLASSLGHYLTNVYFLLLFLDWGLDEEVGPPRLSGSMKILTLFEKLFVRELKKTKREGREPDLHHAAKYLLDTLAPVVSS